MGKERNFNLTNKKKARTSGFIHVGEIISGTLDEMEKRVKKSHKRKTKESTKEES